MFPDAGGRRQRHTACANSENVKIGTKYSVGVLPLVFNNFFIFQHRIPGYRDDEEIHREDKYFELCIVSTVH